MKSVSAGLAAHLATKGGGATTLATCWKCTRADGTVFGFTDHDRDLVVSGVTYAAATGYTRSAIATTAALSVDNLDLEGALDAAAITEADLRAGLWDYCAVEIFTVNWADLTQGVLQSRKGRLGEVRVGRATFSAELRGLMQNVQQEIGRLYGPACDADLGDARCGVTLASFTVTGTLTGVTSRRVFADTGRTEADDWFEFGKLTWTSGLNDGLAMEVKGYTQSGGAIALVLPMPYDVQIGDGYSMSAGCDKSLATCKAKFNNVVNFRGFPHVPGTDFLVSGRR